MDLWWAGSDFDPGPAIAAIEGLSVFVSDVRPEKPISPSLERGTRSAVGDRDDVGAFEALSLLRACGARLVGPRLMKAKGVAGPIERHEKRIGLLRVLLEPDLCSFALNETSVGMAPDCVPGGDTLPSPNRSRARRRPRPQ